LGGKRYASFIYDALMTNDATLKIGLSCQIGLLVLPLAGAVSGKLSRGACSKWGGAGSDFPVPFLSLDRFGGGCNNYLAGLSR